MVAVHGAVKYETQIDACLRKQNFVSPSCGECFMIKQKEKGCKGSIPQGHVRHGGYRLFFLKVMMDAYSYVRSFCRDRNLLTPQTFGIQVGRRVRHIAPEVETGTGHEVPAPPHFFFCLCSDGLKTEKEKRKRAKKKKIRRKGFPIANLPNCYRD